MVNSDPPFILFLHIPKTAGTTLRSVADLQFGRKNVITYYHQKTADTLNNLDYMLRDDRHNYRALIGHFRFGVHEKLSRAACYVTFLRDPVALTISAYNERLKTFTAEFEKPDGSMKTIEEHLAENQNAYANLQTKLIAGTASEAVASEDDLEQAIENMDQHFVLTAPVARFDEAVLLLCRHLNWQPCLYGNLNKGPSHDFASPQVRQLIEEMCGLDQRLLDYVAARFDAEIAAAGPLFTDAMTELQQVRGAPDFQNQVDANIDAAWFTDLPSLGAYLGQAPG